MPVQPGDKVNRYGSRDFFRRFYDERYGDYLNFRRIALVRHHHEIALNVLVSATESRTLTSIADMGCAIGDFSEQVRRLFPEARVLGIDFLKEGLEHGVEKYPEVFFCQAQLPFVPLRDHSLDAIVCMEVLYYLNSEAQRIAIEEFSRVLKRDGLILVATNLGDEQQFMLEEELLELFNQRFELARREREYLRIYRFFELYVRRAHQFILRRPRLLNFTSWLLPLLRFVRRNMLLVHAGNWLGKMLMGEKAVTNAVYVFSPKHRSGPGP